MEGKIISGLIFLLCLYLWWMFYPKEKITESSNSKSAKLVEEGIGFYQGCLTALIWALVFISGIVFICIFDGC